MLGAFIKTPHHAVAETMGRAGLDFTVIDAEHAPFDLAAIDRVVLAAASAGLPCLVRPAGHPTDLIGQCLDLGAAGILAPHVADAGRAGALAAATRYAGGARGFSPSTRAGGFGTIASAELRASADRTTTLWCQIEDAAALSHLEAIAAVEAVDCLFVGRADLSLSLGVEGNDHPKLIEAMAAVARAARAHGKAFGAYLGGPQEIGAFLALGATALVVGTDQAWLMAQGRANRGALTEALKG